MKGQNSNTSEQKILTDIQSHWEKSGIRCLKYCSTWQIRENQQNENCLWCKLSFFEPQAQKSFLIQLFELQETQNHHALILLNYRSIEIYLNTHEPVPHIGDKDTALALAMVHCFE